MSVWSRSKNDLCQLAKDLQFVTIKRRSKHGKTGLSLDSVELIDFDKKDSEVEIEKSIEDLEENISFKDPRISTSKQMDNFTVTHSVSAPIGNNFVTSTTAQKCSITDGTVRLHRAPTSVTTFRPISPAPFDLPYTRTQDNKIFTVNQSNKSNTSNVECQTLPYQDRLGTGTTCSFASSIDSVSSRSVNQDQLKSVLQSVSRYTDNNNGGSNKHLTKILRQLCRKQHNAAETHLDNELSDVKKRIGDLQQVCVSLSRFNPQSTTTTDMETSNSSTSYLDTEFDKVLVDMKPYVLKLPEKSDRQRCAVWIKKLCEPVTSGVSARKNRNLHAQLMLRMLRRGTLQSPFDKKPMDGALPPLPTYMSIYFDEPMNGGNIEDKTPDWVSGELTHSYGSSLFQKSTYGDPTASSTFLTSSSIRDIKERFNAVVYSPKQRPFSSLGVTLDKDPLLSLSNRDDKSVGFAMDDMSIDLKSSPTHSHLDRERRTLPDVRSKFGSSKSPERKTRNQVTEDWTKPFSHDHFNPSMSSKGSYSDEHFNLRSSEVETKLKILEVKFQEEKLKLQQKHDISVQKIIDRKNIEIDCLKKEYNSKIKELEEVVTKLDRKVQSLVRESSTVKETKEKQVTELKKMIEETEESKRYQYEKKLHDAITEFENEKFEMQKHHTRSIQEILDDTNIKLQRMQKEYSQQTTATSNVIKDLENRVQQLTNEADNTLKQRATLDLEKNELQIKVDRLTANYEDSKERYSQLDREFKNLIENHKQEMKSLKTKTEASLEYIKEEQSISISKNSDTITELEQHLEQLKKGIKDVEESKHRQLREQEQAHQQDKIHLENLHDKQVRSLKKELDQFEQDTNKKLKRLEHTLQDKEEELNRLREQNREQSSQADRALEEFKLQVERNQSRMYEETKQQMTKVQNDLNKSKQSREKQAQEFSRQLEDERFQHDKELAELKIVFDNDKSTILRDLHGQKEFMLCEQERVLDTIKEAHRNELNCLEDKLKSVQERDNKTMRELETQQRELREELVQSNQLRKQQLVELGLLRDEEKQKLQRDHEITLTKLRNESEQQRLELQKQHSSEMEQMLQKTNDRLKDIEREKTDKVSKSTETITMLQATIDHLRTEIKRLRESNDKKSVEIDSLHEEEKKSIRKQFSGSIQKVQHELDVQKNKSRSLERKLQKEEIEHEEKITKLKLTYEDRLRGLIPLEVRGELEETIEALKSQVNSLQQRAKVLQDEVDNRINNKQFNNSTPIIKAV